MGDRGREVKARERDSRNVCDRGIVDGVLPGISRDEGMSSVAHRRAVSNPT